MFTEYLWWMRLSLVTQFRGRGAKLGHQIRLTSTRGNQRKADLQNLDELDYEILHRPPYPSDFRPTEFHFFNTFVYLKAKSINKRAIVENTFISTFRWLKNCRIIHSQGKYTFNLLTKICRIYCCLFQLIKLIMSWDLCLRI